MWQSRRLSAVFKVEHAVAKRQVIKRFHKSVQSTIIMSVTLHTDLGDMKIELHCEKIPKACEVSFD